MKLNEPTERDSSWEAAWKAEHEARLDAMDRGEEVPRDWEEALADLWQSLRMQCRVFPN